MEARSIAAWDALDIESLDPPVRADVAQSELERLGGARLILEVDAQALRKEMLELARDDVRRAVREARIGSPATAVIRGETIEFQPRDGVDASAVANAFAPLTSGSYPSLMKRPVEGERAARGVLAFAVPDQLFRERLQSSRQASMEVMERRIREIGIGTGLVQALDDRRILVITPGLKEPERLFQILDMRAKLTLRMVDRSGDPCATTPPPEGSEVLRHHTTKSSLLVQRRVVVSGEDVVASAVVRQDATAERAVALRFNLNGARRLAQATRDDVGRDGAAPVIAVVLDNEVLAALVIREPLTSGAVLMSGGLDVHKARELALLLRAGLIPAPLRVVDRQIVEAKPR